MLRDYNGIFAGDESDFMEPYKRVHNTLENWVLGSRDVGFTESDHNTHIWHFFIRDNKIVVEREDDPENFSRECFDFTEISDTPVVTEMMGDFDQVMREYCIFKLNNEWYRLYYIQKERKVDKLQKKFTNCKLVMDTKTRMDIGRSDVCLFYINRDTQSLSYGLQRDEFLEEHILINKVPNKSYIQKVGLDKKDEKVLIQWR